MKANTEGPRFRAVVVAVSLVIAFLGGIAYAQEALYSTDITCTNWLDWPLHSTLAYTIGASSALTAVGTPIVRPEVVRKTMAIVTADALVMCQARPSARVVDVILWATGRRLYP